MALRVPSVPETTRAGSSARTSQTRLRRQTLLPHQLTPHPTLLSQSVNMSTCAELPYM